MKFYIILLKIRVVVDKVFWPLFMLFYIQRFTHTYIVPQDILYWIIMAMVIFSSVFWFEIDEQTRKFRIPKNHYLAAAVWGTGVSCIILFWLGIVGAGYTWLGLVLTLISGFLIKPKTAKDKQEEKDHFDA
jgi:hypothetical protein